MSVIDSLPMTGYGKFTKMMTSYSHPGEPKIGNSSTGEEHSPGTDQKKNYQLKRKTEVILIYLS